METQRSLLAPIACRSGTFCGRGFGRLRPGPARPAAPTQVARGSRPQTAREPRCSSWMRSGLIRSRLRTPSWHPGDNGAVVLSGVVGTKQAHDVAVRIAIDTGVPFRDNLVIDTGAVASWRR